MFLNMFFGHFWFKTTLKKTFKVDNSLKYAYKKKL